MKFARIMAILSVLGLLVALGVGSIGVSAQERIDNSDLIPPYRPHDKVDVEQSGDLWSPDWVDELIMAELRIETCTPEGTFQAAERVLDHYAEMGVNGLWITPVYDRPDGDLYTMAGYGNYGPHTVWEKLTGTEDYEESWKIVRQFVDKAHARGIRIFFDVVVWGCEINAPLYKEKPEIFSGNQVWGGWGFSWSRPAFKDWFVQTVCDMVRVSGIDGLRCDLEPTITGYGVFARVRDTLYYDHDIKIAIFSEGASGRAADYDFEQCGMYSSGFLDAAEGEFIWYEAGYATEESGEPLSPAQMMKQGLYRGPQAGGGSFRYYTYNLLNHDDPYRNVRGSRLYFGWQAVFTPFIPMWYIGEEWNNPRKGMGGSGVVYFDYIDWTALDTPENRAFFEDIKRYIRIRRTYPEIFQYFPNDSRDANICDVKVSGGMSELAAYARYMGERAVIVVPNDDIAKATLKVTIPYAQMGMGKKDSDVYTVTDLLTGKQIAKGTAKELKNFKGTVESDAIGVYLVEGPQVSKPTTGKPTTNSTKQPADTTTAVPSATEPSAEEQETTTQATTSSTVTAATTTVAQEDSTADNADGGLPLGAVLGVAGGAIVLAAAVLALLVLKKKKR